MMALPRATSRTMSESVRAAIGIPVSGADIPRLDAAGNTDCGRDAEHGTGLKQQSDDSGPHETLGDIVLIQFMTRTHAVSCFLR